MRAVRLKEQVEAMNLLMREMSNVHKTRKRLYLLRFRVPTRADVYGQYAQQPGVLAESLERWESHSESARVSINWRWRRSMSCLQGCACGSPACLSLPGCTLQALGRSATCSPVDQNRSIGAPSSAGSGLPGATLLPSSLLVGGVSSLLNSSK